MMFDNAFHMYTFSLGDTYFLYFSRPLSTPSHHVYLSVTFLMLVLFLFIFIFIFIFLACQCADYFSSTLQRWRRSLRIPSLFKVLLRAAFLTTQTRTSQLSSYTTKVQWCIVRWHSLILNWREGHCSVPCPLPFVCCCCCCCCCCYCCCVTYIGVIDNVVGI